VEFCHDYFSALLSFSYRFTRFSDLLATIKPGH
jgi:hypothetical protein